MFPWVVVHQTLACEIHCQRTGGFYAYFSFPYLVSTLAVGLQYVDQFIGYLPLFAFVSLPFVLARARYTTTNIISVIY